MIIALNNKSNLGKEEFASYLSELSKIKTEDKVVLCPTYLNIPNIPNNYLYVGAQNVSCEEEGAHTGEVSASQLSSYGVQYCIVGHSERRQDQRETPEEIQKKVKALITHGIKPILCVGETEEERKEGLVKEILLQEINSAMEGLTGDEQSRIIIAYEPIWSIGTGVIPTKEEIKEVFLFINTLRPASKVLYGGSANEENIDMLKEISEIDGYLLGGLSLKPDKLKIFLKKLNPEME